jgi:hypothetical protein
MGSSNDGVELPSAQLQPFFHIELICVTAFLYVLQKKCISHLLLCAVQYVIKWAPKTTGTSHIAACSWHDFVRTSSRTSPSSSSNFRTANKNPRRLRRRGPHRSSTPPPPSILFAWILQHGGVVSSSAHDCHWRLRKGGLMMCMIGTKCMWCHRRISLAKLRLPGYVCFSLHYGWYAPPFMEMGSSTTQHIYSLFHGTYIRQAEGLLTHCAGGLFQGISSSTIWVSLSFFWNAIVWNQHEKYAHRLFLPYICTNHLLSTYTTAYCWLIY